MCCKFPVLPRNGDFYFEFVDFENVKSLKGDSFQLEDRQ